MGVVVTDVSVVVVVVESVSVEIVVVGIVAVRGSTLC